MARDLRDKVIVITGGSSGIGAATAIACAKAGMDVVVAARRVEKLEQVARQVEALGRSALAVPCDVGRDQDVNDMVRQTLDRFGRLEVLFANAGYGLFSSVLDTTDEQARAIFETNFFGTVRAIRAAAPVMLNAGGGHVVICSSAASEVALPMYGWYAATKAAQDSIGGALRAELAGRGIDVTTVHPIGTRSEFFEQVDERSSLARAGLNTPGLMMHTPEQVARAVVHALRRPKPEVWPAAASRFAVAIVTAFPRLGAWAMRRHYRRITGHLCSTDEAR